MSALPYQERGELLAEALPEDVVRVLWEVGDDLTPAEWAVRLEVAHGDVAELLDWMRTEKLRIIRRHPPRRTR